MPGRPSRVRSTDGLVRIRRRAASLRGWEECEPRTLLATLMVSTNFAGSDGGDFASFNPMVDASGRTIAFESNATNLVAGLTDTNDGRDVFVRDLVTGANELVSVNAAGTGPGDSFSFDPFITPDGRFVSFGAAASDLVADDTNGDQDVFVRDRQAGTTVLASVNAAGTGSGNGLSNFARLSADGRYVSFQSEATDLVTGFTDTNLSGGFSGLDVFVRDLQTGVTRLISRNAAGTGTGNGTSYNPVISADGRYVAFSSDATDLLPGVTDTNGNTDVFLYDMLTDTLTLVSQSTSGAATGDGQSTLDTLLQGNVLSPDGRYLAYISLASDLDPGVTDTNGDEDVFVFDRVTGTSTLVSVNAAGTAAGGGASADPWLSDDGHTIAFQSQATDLVAGLADTNGIDDVFVRDLVAGTTAAVSLNAAGTATASGFSLRPVLSSDGRTVAFRSFAVDIDPRDTDTSPDIYARDLASGTTRLVTVNAAGTGGAGGQILSDPVLNADGSVIAFQSDSTTLVPGDRNGTDDVFAVTDRPTVQFESADYSATEGDPSVTVTLRRTGDTSAPLTVTVNTFDGTATAGADYTAVNQTVTFLAGEDTATVVVPLLDDSVYEAYDTFTVRVGDPSAPIFIGSPQGTVVTVFDDEPGPVISVSDTSALEGDNGQFNSLDFTVSLSFASPRDVTFTFFTRDVTAVESDDYFGFADPIVVTIPAGTTVINGNLITAGDTVPEPDETFELVLSNPFGATLGRAVGTATIINDDPLPVASVSDVSTVEGDSGTTSVTFHVTLSFASTGTTTVSYATQDGTATAPGDYAPVSGTLTFDPGVTDQTVTVDVAGDTLFEADETFQLVLSNPTAATLGQAGTATITNDDPAPSLSVADVSVAEGDSGTTALTFHVTLSAAAGVPVTVAYAAQDGTATSPGDYAPASGTLTFAPGVTDLTVTVDVAGETLFETDESFQLVLSNPSGATLGQAAATGTIVNDDTAPSLSVADVSAAEGDAGTTSLTFHVTLSAPSGLPVTVAYTTQDGTATAAGDYASASGTLTFAPGVTDQTVTVDVAGETLFEADETFQLVLTNPSGATLGQPTATGTVVNDDAPPSLSVSDVSGVEGNSGTTPFTFHVTLSAPSALPVTVTYSTPQDGTADANGDYAFAFGTLTFDPGVTDLTVTVNVLGETVFEADEFFHLQLGNPSGATLAQPVGTGTIINDDPVPTLSVSDVSVTEGNAGTTALTFHVTMSNRSSQVVQVAFATQDLTATAPLDYAPAFGTLTFLPLGATDQTVTVDVAGETLFEADETFQLVLTNPSGASLGRAAATGTIVNDDAAPSLSVADVSTAEGNSGTTALTFHVVLSTPSGLPVTVAFATQDGTAAAPGDYASASGTLTFAPGVTDRTVTVTVVGDALFEADETLRLALSNPSGATLARGTATGTITNDDFGGALRFSTTQYSGAEGGGAVVVTVERTGGGAGGVSVTVSAGGGSATDDDFAASGLGVLTFGPGEVSKSVAIAIVDDALLEGPENVTLSLSGATGGASLGAPATATLTIADNDDTDGDGISNADEGAGPNGGDANGDGIPDSQQPEVASFPNAADGRYVTLVGPAGSTIVGTHALTAVPAGAPAGLTFPVGLFGFTVRLAQPGARADVAVLLPPGVTADTYLKYGGTPGDPAPHWYTFDNDGTTGATINPGVVVLHLVDGLRGDGNLMSDGLIFDPGGPAEVTQADLVLTATPPAVRAVAGRPLTYTLTVTNAGPADATNVVLTSSLPAGARLGAVAVSQGTFGVSGGVITASLGDLAAGATATVVVTVTPAASGTLSVTGRARGDQPDPDGGNDVAGFNLGVAAADTSGPRVVRLQRFGVHNQPTRLVLTFDRALNPATAVAAANYRLRAAGADGRFGTRDDRTVAIRGLSYDATTRTVTIVTAQRLDLRRAYRLTVNGNTLGAVADTLGRRLDGDQDGRAGGNAVLTVNRAVAVLPTTTPAPTAKPLTPAKATINRGPLAVQKGRSRRP